MAKATTRTTTTRLIQDTNLCFLPQIMDAIDAKVAELKDVFDNDNEVSAEDCKLLGYITFHERAQTFEPYKIYQFDVIRLLKKYNVIEWSRPESSYQGTNSRYTREEDRKLRGYLLSNWKKISFNDKVVFHALNGSLPYWGHFYYPPEQRGRFD
jgi:hypothetical protein